MHGLFIPQFPKLVRFQEHFDKILRKKLYRLYKHLGNFLNQCVCVCVRVCVCVCTVCVCVCLSEWVRCVCVWVSVLLSICVVGGFWGFCMCIKCLKIHYIWLKVFVVVKNEVSSNIYTIKWFFLCFLDR